MLTKIRDKATGWIAYAIVILISIPFALWGIQQYFGLDSSPVAIEVDDQEITEFQVEQALLNKKRALEEAQPNHGFTDEEIKTEVISELISAQLLDIAVSKYGLQTTDFKLAEFIRNRPEFEKDQDFDVETYRDVLARGGFSPTAFEQAQREVLKEEQFIVAIQDSSFILPSERKRYVHLSDQKRKIRYLPVSYSYFIEPDSIDTEQAQAHYEENTALYQSPYKARFDYLEIDIPKIEERQTIGEEEARKYYEENADDYLYPEKFNLRHILVSTEDRNTAAALEEAEDIYLQLEEGADFAELARNLSDDELTSESGGELPELTAEELENEEVRNAVLQLAQGEYTLPILTQYGVQIFQLINFTEAEQKPFEVVREELIGDIKRRMAEIRYADLIENLDLLLFEDEIGFFTAVRNNYGYNIQSTGFLDIDKQESILANPRIKATIVSEIIQGGKTNTGLIELETGKRFFFVGITGSEPSRQLSFEEAMQDIVTDLILEQAYQKLQANNEAWLQEIQAGTTSIDDIAEENQWIIEDTGYIERTETSIPRPIVETVYKMSPLSKLPAYQTLQLDQNYNNDNAIIELLDIQAGVETSQTFVVYSLKNRESVAVLDSLRDFYEIKINLEENE